MRFGWGGGWWRPLDVVPLLSAIVVWYGERVTTNFGGAGVVPSQSMLVYFFFPQSRRALTKQTGFNLHDISPKKVWLNCWIELNWIKLNYIDWTFFLDSDSYTGSYFQYGEGRRTTVADWTWRQGAIAVDVVPLLGAGRGGPTFAERTWCHCWVLGGRRVATTKFRGVDVAPLLGGDDQLWGSGRGAIARFRFLLLLTASSCIQGHQFHPDT